MNEWVPILTVCEVGDGGQEHWADPGQTLQHLGRPRRFIAPAPGLRPGPLANAPFGPGLGLCGGVCPCVLLGGGPKALKGAVERIDE